MWSRGRGRKGPRRTSQNMLLRNFAFKSNVSYVVDIGVVQEAQNML